MTFGEFAQISTVVVAGCVTFSLGDGLAFAHGGGDEMFQKADTNGDGKISPDEHAAVAKKMFEMMDSNKDSKVTAEEMTLAHAKMESMTGKMDKAHDKAPDKRHEMSAAEKIKAVDANGDGVLTAEEHAAGAKTMFVKMDTDHDGYLSKTEMAVGHAKLMRKGDK